MPAEFRHYIWDFDGTLFDSYPHIAHTFCALCADAGISVPFAEADAALRISFGHARKLFALPDGLYAAFHEKQKEDFDPPIHPYAACRTTLEMLAARGSDHYIYTHRDSKSLAYYLDKYGFSRYFAGQVTADEAFPIKPAPNALLALTARHGLSLSDCMMIGDREIDVLAGKNAGMAACLFDARGRAPDTAADFTVTSLLSIATLSR